MCKALVSSTPGKWAISCRNLTRCGRKMRRWQWLWRQNCQQSSFLSSGSIYNQLAGDEVEHQVLQSMYNVGSGLRKSSLRSVNWGAVGWAWGKRGEHHDKWNRLDERKKGIFFFSLSYCININQETSFMSLQLGQIFQIIVNCGSHQTAGYSIIETSQNTAAVRCSSISKRVVMSWCSLPTFMVIVKKTNKHILFQQLGLAGAWYPKLAELRWSCAPPEIK